MIREKLSPVSLKGSLPVYFYAWHGGEVPELPEPEFEKSSLYVLSMDKETGAVSIGSHAAMLEAFSGIDRDINRSVAPRRTTWGRESVVMSSEAFEKLKRFEESVVGPHLDLVDSNSRQFYDSMPYARFIRRKH